MKALRSLQVTRYLTCWSVKFVGVRSYFYNISLQVFYEYIHFTFMIFPPVYRIFIYC